MADPFCDAFAPGEVDVWFLDLRVGPEVLDSCVNILSFDELARMQQFRFEKLRERYAAGRGALRALLSHYCNIAAGMLRFGSGQAGKPHLLGFGTQPVMEFNVAHSEDLAVFAFGRGVPVGVDVERVRPLPDAGSLVRQFFCPAESRVFAALPERQQHSAFFNLWTRKEALLKATGEGIAHSLNRVEVSFLPGEPAMIKALPAAFGAMADWSLIAPEAPAGFVVAVAAESSETRIRNLSGKAQTSKFLKSALGLQTGNAPKHEEARVA